MKLTVSALSGLLGLALIILGVTCAFARAEAGITDLPWCIDPEDERSCEFSSLFDCQRVSPVIGRHCAPNPRSSEID